MYVEKQYKVLMAPNYLTDPIKAGDFISDYFGATGRCTSMDTETGLIECSMFSGLHPSTKFNKISYVICDLHDCVVVGLVSLGAIWVKHGDILCESNLERGGGSILFYTEDLKSWRKSDNDTMPGSTPEGNYQYVKILNGSCNCYH